MPHFHRFHRWFTTATFLGGLLSCQGAPIPLGKVASPTVAPSVPSSSWPTESPGTGPVVSTPVPSLSPMPTASPQPGFSLPPDAIKLKAEILGGSFYCQKQNVPEHPIIQYPSDLAVTPDGQTVYVINTACFADVVTNLRWKSYYQRYGKQFPKLCTETEKKLEWVRKQSYVYQVQANKAPQILMQGGEPLLSCRLGLEIEMDEKGTLYFTDIPNSSVFQYDFRQLQVVATAHESSSLSDGSPGDYGAFHFGIPVFLKSAPDKIYFESGAYADTGSESYLARVFPSSHERKDIAYAGGHLYLFAEYKGSLFLFEDNQFSNAFGGNGSLIKILTFPIDLSSSHPELKIPLHWKAGQEIVAFDFVVSKEGLFYLSDIQNHSIWSMTLNPAQTEGELKLLAGSGQAGYHDGQGEQASFSTPTSLSVDAAGNLYVADTGNSAIRKVTPEGVVTTFYKAPD